MAHLVVKLFVHLALLHHQMFGEVLPLFIAKRDVPDDPEGELGAAEVGRDHGSVLGNDPLDHLQVLRHLDLGQGPGEPVPPLGHRQRLGWRC